MSNDGRVVILDLGRRRASGARRRVRSLVASLESVGFEVVVVELLPEFRSSPWSVLQRLPSLARSRTVVPESIAWSPAHVRAHLDVLSPDVVICQTARAFDPALAGPWRLIVDFVDRLSDSYADRGVIAHNSIRRPFYRWLARRHHRFESGHHASVVGAFAAGHADAVALDVPWIPISLDPALLEDGTPGPHESDIDVLFVGTLDYPPNIEAMSALGELWPEVLARRPGTTAAVAGARPTEFVVELATRFGWHLIADFADARDVLRRGRLSIAPLRHASGIQIKVLDAGAFGVAQIVSPIVKQGFDAEFPVSVCATPSEWVAEICRLLDTPTAALELADQCRNHLLEQYTPELIGERLLEVLGIRP